MLVSVSLALFLISGLLIDSGARDVLARSSSIDGSIFAFTHAALIPDYSKHLVGLQAARVGNDSVGARYGPTKHFGHFGACHGAVLTNRCDDGVAGGRVVVAHK